MCFRSKAISVIILCSFLMYIGFYFSLRAGPVLLRTSMNLQNISTQAITITYKAFHGFNYLLYPLGGLLSDIVWGRYTVVKRTLIFLLITATMLVFSGALIVAVHHNPSSWGNDAAAISLAVYGCLVLLSMIALVPFFATVIPFAMDQLRDSPAQDSSAFIYWYIWTSFATSVLSAIIFDLIFNFTYIFGMDVPDTNSAIAAGSSLMLASMLVFVMVAALYFVIHQKREWFNVEPCNVNPYKLVLKVTKFAWQHKIPVRRSAFTYCEDNQPSRLDLGKSKYGGPFTTEEVEDVKVFYEILKVLVSLGPFMYLFEEFSTTFGAHLLSDNFSGKFNVINAGLSYSLIAFVIFLYLIFRQFRLRLFKCLPTIPSIRKLEIGITILLVKLAFMLLVDVLAHFRNEGLGCMFTEKTVHQVFPTLPIVVILVVNKILSALSVAILYTSFLEFVCSQSPQSMKGMLIGLAYGLLLGLFGLLKFSLVAFNFWTRTDISCGFMYYGINLVIGLAAFVVFLWVAKRYRYRQRDEPSRVRQYAEEYYSRPRQEPDYDSDSDSPMLS